MAKVKRNLLTQGLHGSIGDQLTFVTNGKETVVKSKYQGSSVPATQAQIEHRIAFGKAVQSGLAQGLSGTAQQTRIRDILQSTYPNANNSDGEYN